jgi:hypothetical protein
MATGLPTKRRALLARWTNTLRRHFSHLSLPEIKGLALWSLGIVLARSSSLHAVVLSLACWLGFNPLSLRRRLQEWYREAAAKKGHGTGAWGVQRRAWDPHTVVPDLLAWILEEWPSPQLVLALDPTNFGDRFTVLNISVLYRGCAIPVLWTVVEGTEPGAWEPHWERMLRELAGRLTSAGQVLVLTDRGMYSPSLFHCLRDELHWHPLLRIRGQGFYRPVGSHKWLDLNKLRPTIGESQAFHAEIFKNPEGRLDGTLLVFHGAGYAEPWLLVTDLPPEVAQARWYGLRAWIEQGYKRLKGEGWHLPRTRITDCQRLERLWLAVAVATLWVLKAGGDAEVAEATAADAAANGADAAANGADVPPAPPDEDSREEATPTRVETGPEKPHRIWSVFARGWNLVRNGLAAGLWVMGSWYPEPWPDHPPNGLPTVHAAQPAVEDSPGTHQQTRASSNRRIHEENSS